MFLQVGAGQQADGELDESGPGLQAADLRRGHQGHRRTLDERYREGIKYYFCFSYNNLQLFKFQYFPCILETFEVKK